MKYEKFDSQRDASILANAKNPELLNVLNITTELNSSSINFCHEIKTQLNNIYNKGAEPIPVYPNSPIIDSPSLVDSFSYEIAKQRYIKEMLTEILSHLNEIV